MVSEALAVVSEYSSMDMASRHEILSQWACLVLLAARVDLHHADISRRSQSSDSHGFLLLHCFDDLRNFNEDCINMFVITSVRWLCSTRIPSAAPATISSILRKMIGAAEAISCQSRRDIHGCRDAKDSAWVQQLWSWDEWLSENYGQLFRRLLHVLETSFCRDVLVGDQDRIRQLLHRCLKTAHSKRMCEAHDCPWIFHLSYDALKCPLLAKGENHPAGSSSANLSWRPVGSSQADLSDVPAAAASRERLLEDTRTENLDATIIVPSALPRDAGHQDFHFTSRMTSGNAQDAVVSIHSPATAFDTTASHTPLSTTHFARVGDVAPYALCVGHANSMAVIVSLSPCFSAAADEVGLSDSHIPESPSHDPGELCMGDQGASCGNIAAQGAESDALLSAANVQQHETVPFTATETGSAGRFGAARGTSNKMVTPEAVVSDPTTTTPLLVSNAPRAMSTLDSQPFASLDMPLLDPTEPSSVEIRSSRSLPITTVNSGHSAHESSQSLPTSRVASAVEHSRKGHGLYAEREEGPRRSASSLFQGARAVSRQGSEEFELAVRDGHAGKDSGRNEQEKAESG